MSDFETTVNYKYTNLLKEYKEAVQEYGDGSFEASTIKRQISEFEYFFDEYFGLVLA